MPNSSGFKAASQSGNAEADFLLLASYLLEIPETCLEFGFQINEFNCWSIAKKGFRTCLIDGNIENVKKALIVKERYGLDNLAVHQFFLETENLGPAKTFIESIDGQLGVLSVDIDGNDYYLAKAILSICKPSVIVVEVNASMQWHPQETVGIPYIQGFNREDYLCNNWYHGASPQAFYRLMENHGYILARVVAGLNHIYMRSDQDYGDWISPIPYAEIKQEHYLRNAWSGTNSKEQWEILKDMEFQVLGE